jgi:hypothetical protein
VKPALSANLTKAFARFGLTNPLKQIPNSMFSSLFYSSGGHILIPACEKGTAFEAFILIKMGVMASKHRADDASPAL